MALASMESIAADLSSLAGRVSAIEDHPGDSIAVPNIYVINSKGETVPVIPHGETGFAVLEDERAPAPGDFRKPGVAAWELMNSAGIISDSIGALQTEGIVELPNEFHKVPTPFISASPGVLTVHPRATVPTLQEAGGKLLTEEISGFQLFQLIGAGGTEAILKIPKPGEGEVGVDIHYYGSNGKTIGSFGGSGTAKFKFPEDGIIYLMFTDQSYNKGKPHEPGRIEFPITFEEINNNPFEFPTFHLPEGFLYVVSTEFGFVTSAAPSASGLVAVEVALDLFPAIPNRLRSSSVYSITNDVVAGEAIEPDTFEFIVGLSAVAIVPKGQTNGYAEGGTRVEAQPSLPGNETTYAWSKQKVVIQQIGF